MKWYNSDKTRGLNINSIDYWEYWPEKYLNERTALYVWIGGVEKKFDGAEADEIYKMICSNKELLQS